MSELIHFDVDAPGLLPPRWEQGVTGKGTARWAVRQDASAPSQPHVLQQSGTATFAWCVLRASAIVDGYVETRFKPLAGKEDQAGGVVWRWQDGDNYYVARANALENNVSLYYTANGRRITLKYAVEDSHIAAAGRVGLWTKADSVTSFDDFAYGATR